MPRLLLQTPLRCLLVRVGWRPVVHSRLVATTPLALVVGLPLRVLVLRRVLLRLRVLGMSVFLLLVRLGAPLELVVRWSVPVQG